MLFLIIVFLVFVGLLFRLVVKYECALIEISHYHGDSVEELRDIAYTARKGKNWRDLP